MNTRTRTLTVLTATLVALVAGACLMTDEHDPDTPEVRADAPVEGASYRLDLATAPSEAQLHAIAQFIEARAQGVEQAKVKFHAADGGELRGLEVELWGTQLPGDDLEAALRQEFDLLADAELVVTALDGSAATPADHGIEPGDDPETIERKIIEDLRADGVEGEIDVTVTPTDDGHYEVEVDVREQH